MQISQLTPAFYEVYKDYPEIMNKDNRPYYIMVIKLDNLTFAIPLRSHIKHKDCFITDGHEGGLDFSKTVIITDFNLYISQNPVTIHQKEFNFLKYQEYTVNHKFLLYLKQFKKEAKRYLDNPNLPLSNFYQYSTLKYFLKELGLTNGEQDRRLPH